METKITVIIPNFNNAPWLGRCLDSVLAQTHHNLEILVVDDGSSDPSAQVIGEYENRDSRVRGIFQKNGGVTSARLAGAAQATGDWIAFVDSDDAIEPEMYARLLKNAVTYNADISHCGHRMIYPDGRVDYYYNTGKLWKQDRETGLRELLEEKKIEPGVCNKLYKRELFAGLEAWMDRSLKNNEDLLMNFYLFGRAQQSVFEDICPYLYLIRENSASRRKLNAHLIYDPIRAKRIILEQCSPELREDARRAMAETCLYTYAKLALEKDSAYDIHRENVRKAVLEQEPYVDILSRKNALLVRLVRFSPRLFRLVYRTYAFVLNKK